MRENAKPTKGSKVNARKEPQELKIVRVTAKQAKQMPSRTDWKRVRSLTDADIARAVAGDDDTFEFTDDMLAQVRSAHPEPKDLVSLRLDRSIVEFFKSRGPKYTSQINAVLKAFVMAQERATKASTVVARSKATAVATRHGKVSEPAGASGRKPAGKK